MQFSVNQHFFAQPGNKILILCKGSGNQVEALQLLHMLRAGGKQIKTGGFQAAVSQYIRQLDDIVTQRIKGSGKEMPQIVRKNLAAIHAGRAAQALQLRPDLPAATGSSLCG